MRIVLVNWARIWDGAGYGGGVNGYCQSLALALLQRGHEVVSLFGGITFVPSPTPDQTRPCFLRRHDDWLGVRVFEVINSPVMAPSIVQYQDPLGEVSSPELEAEVARLFGLIKPDVVHFHNVEGFSIGCVDVARKAGARVLFSLHNYHTICPQVYLMQGHRRLCHDSDAGHNCTNCIETKPPAKERYERAVNFRGARFDNPNDLAGSLRRDMRTEWAGLKQDITWPLRVLKRSKRMLQLRRQIIAAGGKVIPDLAGHPVDSAESATRPMPVPTPTHPEAYASKMKETSVKRAPSYDFRGQTQGVLDELNWKPKRLDPADPINLPLLNVARPDPPSNKAPNDYGKRRQAMVQMLSSCDKVLAVSQFVRDKFVAMGVDPKVIETMHIGSRIGRIVQKQAEVIFDPPEFDPMLPSAEQRPIRVVFMGYNNLYKGLHVLADALETLTPEYLGRLDLSVYALDGHTIEDRFRKLEPRLAKLTYRYGYQFQELPMLLGGKDLGIVPSVWWDNAPQTVFEFFSCGVPVLGAEAGGIPDFVKEGVNGMLFQANNSWDLARRLAEVVRQPWKLTAFRKAVHPTKDIDAHVLELEELYSGARK